MRASAVDVILPAGKMTAFGINEVKPILVQIKNSDVKPGSSRNMENRGPIPKPSLLMTPELRDDADGDAHASFAVPMYDGSKESFTESRVEEINARRGLGCLREVDESESAGHRLHPPRIVDRIIADNVKRSLLCVAACNDEAHCLFTGAPVAVWPVFSGGTYCSATRFLRATIERSYRWIRSSLVTSAPDVTRSSHLFFTVYDHGILHLV